MAKSETEKPEWTDAAYYGLIPGSQMETNDWTVSATLNGRPFKLLTLYQHDSLQENGDLSSFI